MKSAVAARLSLILALLAPGLRAAESAEATAYRYGALARLAEMDGKYDEALDYFNKSLALKPDAIIYGERATLKADHKDIPGAIADYDKAIALKPGQKELVTLYGNRGSLKQETGDLDGALADYDQVIALVPAEAVIYNNRGAIKGSKGDYAGAISEYSKAIALDPKEAQFYENRAEAREHRGDYAEAITDYDKVIVLEPDGAGHYYYRGNARQRHGDLDGAISDYSRICALKPNQMIGYHIRGIAKQGKADLAGAVADYDLAIARDDGKSGLTFNFREICLRGLHRETPFAELARAVASWQDGWSKSIGLYLLDTLSEQALLTRAGQGQAKELPVQQCSARYFIGMTKLLAGDRVAAQRQFEQCVAAKLWDSDEAVLAKAELARLGQQP